MRRLTLILSDLYLPQNAEGDAVPRVQALPAFEWLLRFAHVERIDDWRRWLIAQLRPGTREIPLVKHCAYGTVPDALLDSCWFATPVHLEARLDHVRLNDRGLARLTADERASACAEFARTFGPQYELHDGGERTFYLSGLAPLAAPTVDPARLLGADIASALPPRDAVELRRLGTEIEMWMHGAAFNAARQRAGRRAVSTLWLWRGFLPDSPRPGRQEPVEAEFLGGDPLLEKLGDHAGTARRPRRGVPESLDQVDAGASHVVAEFATLTGAPHESLPALEENWFRPAMTALHSGRFVQIEIIANDRLFRIGAHARWRVWRRHRGWVEHLMPSARDAKA